MDALARGNGGGGGPAGAGAGAVGDGDDALASSRPLRRTDSSVSARDSKYWLSIASSSGSLPLMEPRSDSFIDVRSSVLDLSHLNTPPSSAPVVLSVRSPLVEKRKDENDDDQGDDVLPVLTPITSPPPPSSGIRLPTRLATREPQRMGLRRERTLFLQRQLRHAAAHRQYVVAEEVYENQRYQMVLGWGAKGHLLPLDPGKYMLAVRRPRSVLNSNGLPIPGVSTHARRRRSISEYAGSGRGNTGTGNGMVNGYSNYNDEHANEEEVEWLHSATFPDISLPDTAPSFSGDDDDDDDEVDDGADGGDDREGEHGSGRGHSRTKGKWEWISPWHLEFPRDLGARESTGPSPSVDPDGWQYATSFQHFQDGVIAANDTNYLGTSPLSASPLVSSTWRPKHYVRRRKWIRFRRFRTAPCTPTTGDASASDISAFDDAFLDSLSGWLKKLGHVRKNWKQRYFVLNKSILRYYADESMARLKGEVLLFHPATRVHYVDIHLSGGRDNCFAVQVGKDYTLLLQAEKLADRENWMFCIEDALLCRDSYHQDPNKTRDLRESVARRRKMSSERMLFTGNASNALAMNPVNMFVLHSKANTNARLNNPHLMRLMIHCDEFLAFKSTKEQNSTFIQRFKQKYSAISPAKNANNSAMLRLSGGRESFESISSATSATASNHSFIGDNVSVLQDSRSLLALKNYRFFIERSLAEVMDHLSQLPVFASPTPITSPKSSRTFKFLETMAANSSNDNNGTEDDWEVTKRAALYKLERETFIPLQDVIYGLLETTIPQDDLERFERNRCFLGEQKQKFFDIPPSHESPSEWQSAIALLNSMDNYSLPSEKASILLEVAKCIYDTYLEEHSTRSPSKKTAQAEATPQMMTADDFLPIFIYVLARSSLRNVVVSRHVISETMVSAVMIGETGYYTTMLEAAIGYVASFVSPPGVDLSGGMAEERRSLSRLSLTNFY